MTAEAIARLREKLAVADKFNMRTTGFDTYDLRALLDARDGEDARTAAAVADASSAAALRAMERAVKAEAERDHWKGRWELDSSGFKGVIAEKMDRIAELDRAAGNWLRQRNLAFDREEALRAELRELREIAERNVADVQHLRQTAIALTDERDALRADVERLQAQVEAARATCATYRCKRCHESSCIQAECHAARGIVRAMDEAKP